MTKRTRKTTTPEPTAPQAYAARRNDIARLLDVLDMELGKHQGWAEADPDNWNRVGDLSKVRRELIDLVAFLSGMEPERVEAFLAD